MCKMTIAFMTLGCKVNYYETEKMKGRFVEAGWGIVEFGDAADVYVVHTCTVTNVADRKSRKALHRARSVNPKAIVAAVGCYAESAGERLMAEDGVDLVVGNEGKGRVLEIVEEAVRKRKGEPRPEGCGAGKSEAKGREAKEPEAEECEAKECEAKEPEALESDVLEPREVKGEPKPEDGGRTRAYVKIQEGCNQFCSYCIIPYVRGRLTSKPIQDVMGEVGRLVEKGYKEVVLSGIHLSSYGVDLVGSTDSAQGFVALEGRYLLDLVEEMARLDGLERIRLSSLEPRVVTEGFAKRCSGVAKLCPHFHLSLQSGCDGTLRRMNRKYTAKEYEEACMRLREHMDNPAITTDVIVGFPGETEEEFAETVRLVRRVGFAKIHVFPYSVRTGTAAESMPDQVPAAVKKERARLMGEWGRSLRRTYMEAFLGGEQRVLLEEKCLVKGEWYCFGHNERYVRFAVREGGVNEVVGTVPTRFFDADTLL